MESIMKTLVMMCLSLVLAQPAAQAVAADFRIGVVDT